MGLKWEVYAWHPEIKYRRGQNQSDRRKDHPLVEERSSIAIKDNKFR